MPLLTIRMSDPVPPGPAVLLAPRLVDAVGFRLRGLEVVDGEIIGEITASNSGQGAYLVRPTAAPRRPQLRYMLDAVEAAPPAWIWQPPETRYARPSEELAGFIRRLVADAGSEADAAQRIADHLGAVFWYGHGPGGVMDGRDSVPLLTHPTRGHCMDMHGYGVAACRAAGLEAAYCAGFWFAEGTSRVGGMHCWFAVRADGDVLHYDVSHQLKLPALPILPGLNPVPGLRVLAAVGKGMMFETPLGTVAVDHFARLVWRTLDGRDHYPAHEIAFEAEAAVAPRDAVPAIEPAC